jgi:hypothetical protein
MGGIAAGHIRPSCCARVRTAFWAAERRFSLPRRSALPRVWRDSAACDAAAVPSRFSDSSAARDLVGSGFRPVALGLRLVAFFPGGGGSFTPALLALDRPMAITCLAERAPCMPSRTCSISSRTYSPACVEADFAFPARRLVFPGTSRVHRCYEASSFSGLPSMEWLHSAGILPLPRCYRSCRASCPCRNPERSPRFACQRSG